MRFDSEGALSSALKNKEEKILLCEFSFPLYRLKISLKKNECDRRLDGGHEGVKRVVLPVCPCWAESQMRFDSEGALAGLS